MSDFILTKRDELEQLNAGDAPIVKHWAKRLQTGRAAMAALDLPVGWRCSWLVLVDIPPFHLKPDHKDYPTRDLAERKRSELREHFGEQIVVDVTPVYLSRSTRQRRLAAQARFGGRPIQMRPARPSFPARKRRT